MFRLLLLLFLRLGLPLHFLLLTVLELFRLLIVSLLQLLRLLLMTLLDVLLAPRISVALFHLLLFLRLLLLHALAL